VNCDVQMMEPSQQGGLKALVSLIHFAPSVADIDTVPIIVDSYELRNGGLMALLGLKVNLHPQMQCPNLIAGR
jgi:hypothetical protein